MTTKPAPYPADTRAKGWRFELECDRIEQSDTWAIASEVPMAQHALLMMWMVAWAQVPCGSMPSDEAVIRTKCRVPLKLWPAMRDVMLRGWWLAEDGRLYHDTVTARVLEMLEYRKKNADRVAKFKAAMLEQRSGNALPAREHSAKNDTGTGTGTIKEIPPTPSRGSVHGFPPGFEVFWSSYPKKVGKDAAAKAFAKRKPDAALLASMVAAVEQQKTGAPWLKDAGQFIPNPATWLNEGRWMDEGPGGGQQLFGGVI